MNKYKKIKTKLSINLNIKSFAAGLIVGVVGLTTVYAATKIKSAEYNANNITFNGEKIDLSSAPMISVIKEGEINASNYMPLRSVLEGMGFGVAWDISTNTAIIVSEEYIKSDSEWINFEEVKSQIKKDKGELSPPPLQYFDNSKSVRATFDNNSSWDIPTINLNNNTYIRKMDAHQIMETKYGYFGLFDSAVYWNNFINLDDIDYDKTKTSWDSKTDDFLYVNLDAPNFLLQNLGVEFLFSGLKSENPFSQYYCINRLIEYYNFEDIRQRLLKELPLLLNHENKQVNDATIFALDILNKQFNSPYITKLKDGSNIFTTFNNYTNEKRN